jgi:2-polyprenyl-3-methyl-5-hydroxy-6-metoxy-1,4-benzoquinol methylase
MLCGTTGKTMHEGLTDFQFEAPGQWTLKQCPNPACALAWLDPFPCSKDLHLAYRSYYTHAQNGGWKRQLRNLLYSLYQFTSDVPATFVGLATERRQLRAMFLHDCSPGKLLDVGCGDGGFLAKMRTRGWQVAGLDFDAKAIANAEQLHGLKLQTGDLISARFAAGTFDAITMNHVIEHVPEPISEFAECHRILRPGGRLVVLTPNILSTGHQVFGRHWRGLEPPRHLHIFSPNALRKCAEEAGLRVIEARSSAGNADVIGGASMSIAQSPNHHLSASPPPSIRRTLAAVIFQYREHSRVKSGAAVGEESVLVCQRD